MFGVGETTTKTQRHQDGEFQFSPRLSKALAPEEQIAKRGVKADAIKWPLNARMY
jgi:hypothetical protein